MTVRAPLRPPYVSQTDAFSCNKIRVFCILSTEVKEDVTETLGDFVRYGYVALPLWVFAEQLGIPIPAAPILLAAGAIASTGRMNLLFLTTLALAGALAADLIWYRAGYSHGSRALGRLCRVCLEPDSCVRARQESCGETWVAFAPDR